MLIPFVLSAAPAKYHAIITSEMRDKAEKLTLDYRKDAMNDQWRLTPEGKKGGNDEDDKEGEVALSAFSGTCFKCGESGHEAWHCRSSEGKRKKFNGNCNHCGKYGHKKADCWLLEENKKNHQKGTMDQNEKGAGAMDASNESNEFLLASSDDGADTNDETELTMAQKSYILKDPNIWIGDTGATSDSTFNDARMQSCKERKSSVTMGEGKPIQPKKIGDIVVTIHNKNDNEMFDAKMTDVAYIPEADFNLFSIRRRLRNGFKLGGDMNSIWSEKKGKKIVFDIVIPTPKGTTYCAYLKIMSIKNDHPEVAKDGIEDGTEGGIEEGATLDTEDGTADGATDETEVGTEGGTTVSAEDGTADGTEVGTEGGTTVSAEDGTEEGFEEEITLGTGDETEEHTVPTETGGTTESAEDGTEEGAEEGITLGTGDETEEETEHTETGGTTETAEDGTEEGVEEGITLGTGDETEEETVPSETDGKQMRRGRATYRPARLADEMNCAELTFADKNYYSILEDE